ncbi:MAG: polyphenol oxidase family protein [Bryobacteraceae bacterium]
MFALRGGLYRAANLDALEWLDHGFGTMARDRWVPDDEAATLRQIHSDVCWRADARGLLGEGDALYTAEPGAWLVIRTADCVPVILADRRHRAVAVVHAGWRGTVGGVVERALERLAAEYATAAADVVAAIGPAIQRCCFEVGPEVAERFGMSGRVRVDLTGEIERRLAGSGVGDVASLGACTKCSAEFHSFRRDGERSGRMQTGVRIIGNG